MPGAVSSARYAVTPELPKKKKSCKGNIQVDKLRENSISLNLRHTSLFGTQILVSRYSRTPSRTNLITPWNRNNAVAAVIVRDLAMDNPALVAKWLLQQHNKTAYVALQTLIAYQ